MTDRLRTVGVVTAGRADYAICRSVIRGIRADTELRLHLIVAGTHLSPVFGNTVEEIVADGFEVGDRVEIPLSSDTPEGIAVSMAAATAGFARAYARSRPDILLVLADRYEMHAAALAALPFRIPVAHIEGGDLTEGAIDDALRHSITKLSHLHFVSTEAYGRRVAQLGEEPWRVTVSGAPSLDNIESRKRVTVEALARKHGVRLEPRPLLVTFHPVTLEYEQTGDHVRQLMGALTAVGRPVIFTAPNADTGGRLILEAITSFVQSHPDARLITNFGTDDYLSILERVAVMVGNSSSGLIEAPSFRLPVVNIGNRQRGRVRAANVIDVGYATDDIVRGIRRAESHEFRLGLRDLVNPYGSGNAAERIVTRLRTVSLADPQLLIKKFHDIQCS